MSSNEPVCDCESLRRWKSEALIVMEGLQDLGRALGVPLGVSITGPEAVRAAEILRDRVRRVEEANREHIDRVDELETELERERLRVDRAAETENELLVQINAVESLLREPRWKSSKSKAARRLKREIRALLDES